MGTYRVGARGGAEHPGTQVNPVQRTLDPKSRSIANPVSLFNFSSNRPNPSDIYIQALWRLLSLKTFIILHVAVHACRYRHSCVCEQRYSWEFTHVSTGIHRGQRCWICWSRDWELNLGSLQEWRAHLSSLVHYRRVVTNEHSMAESQTLPLEEALPVHEHKVEGLSRHPADSISNTL